jgi:inorganic triphosphatase YgiF
MTAAERTVETELRLALARRELPRLLRHAALVAARSGSARGTRLVTTYFDTADAMLARDGIALRLRRERGRWRQSVKGPTTDPAAIALVTRDEFEWPLPDARLDAALLAATPWQAVLRAAAAAPTFAPRFVTDVRRRAFPLALAGGSTALLCIDTGTILDADSDREREIAEIELELVAGDPVELLAFAARLAADLPLLASLPDKATRGYALAAGRPDHPPAPVRATPVPLDAATPTVDALRAVLAECLRQVDGNAAGVLAGTDPEWIHQMRIGLRRTRSLLAIVGAHAPPGSFDALRGELRWLAATLGSARDRDVFDETTLAPLLREPALPAVQRTGVERLRESADRERQRARDAVRDAVGSTRYTRLLLALSALALAPSSRWTAAGIAAEWGGQPAAAFAAGLLARRAHRLEARGRRLAEASAAERHALRIAAKKLRYAAEFFAPAFAGRRRPRDYIAALAQLQGCLGDQNDAATALAIAGRLAVADPSDAVATATIVGWHLARARAGEPALLAAWKAFRRAPRFWPEG